MKYSMRLQDALRFLRLPNPPNIIPVIGFPRPVFDRKTGVMRTNPKTGELVLTSKCPGTHAHFIAWKQFHDRTMTRQEYYQLFRHDDPFDAIGIISGPNKWRCFDFDACPDEYPMFDLLEALGLPEDYNWIVRSGSQNGWHVWILADDLPANNPLPRKGAKDKGIYSATSKYGDFDHLELRYFGCQTLIPPSIHQSGQHYEFYNDEPESPPAFVTTRQVIDAFFALTKAKPLVKVSQPKTHKEGLPQYNALKSMLTPETVFEALGWQYSDDGANYVGECPLHESTSGTCFRWEKEQGFFHCFHAGCEVSGDIISMVKLFLRFKHMHEAAVWCAERFAPESTSEFLFSTAPHPAEHEAYNYV